jgi:hypothetical protein
MPPADVTPPSAEIVLGYTVTGTVNITLANPVAGHRVDGAEGERGAHRADPPGNRVGGPDPYSERDGPRRPP